jgi:hypothetical protein
MALETTVDDDERLRPDREAIALVDLRRDDDG